MAHSDSFGRNLVDFGIYYTASAEKDQSAGKRSGNGLYNAYDAADVRMVYVYVPVRYRCILDNIQCCGYASILADEEIYVSAKEYCKAYD